MKEIPKWVKLGQIARLFEYGCRVNCFDMSELPTEIRLFVAQSKIEESNKWLQEVLNQADTMPIEELTEWIEVFPSGWPRAKLMEILSCRQPKN